MGPGELRADHFRAAVPFAPARFFPRLAPPAGTAVAVADLLLQGFTIQ
jgi:hypothetical protein